MKRLHFVMIWITSTRTSLYDQWRALRGTIVVVLTITCWQLFYFTCAFGLEWKIKIILFSLFLLLFIGFITLFDINHRPHCTISINFYLYLSYFHQWIFNFSKISGIQTHPRYFIVDLCLALCPWKSYYKCRG